ncbi:MAG: hypothetical protein ABIF82_00835 [Planctomycetota bacterium]
MANKDGLELVKLKTAVFRKLEELNSEMCRLEPDYNRAADLGDELVACCLLVVRQEKKGGE